MAVGTRSTTIGGTTFTVQQHPARRAMRLLARLGKIAGPTLGALAGLASKPGSLGGAKIEALGGALGGLFDALTPDEADRLLEELLCFTSVEERGRSAPLWPVFDVVLQGRPLDVLKLAKFSLEVNFGDFLDVLHDLSDKQLPASGLTSEPPST